ncbi:hypothetical protein FOMA001_g40 [Fusarium oxysporum f. sp. matthiolae]|nr:hypothetical protein FOMA001_g40 [Fusarium oxysporum f. sp. matthiolae]
MPKGKPVTNSPNIADAYLYVKVSDRRVVVNVTNFNDVDLIDVAFRISGPGVTFTRKSSPRSIPADGSAAAVYPSLVSRRGTLRRE